jgi:hypothetical protein
MPPMSSPPGDIFNIEKRERKSAVSRCMLAYCCSCLCPLCRDVWLNVQSSLLYQTRFICSKTPERERTSRRLIVKALDIALLGHESAVVAPTTSGLDPCPSATGPSTTSPTGRTEVYLIRASLCLVVLLLLLLNIIPTCLQLSTTPGHFLLPILYLFIRVPVLSLHNQTCLVTMQRPGWASSFNSISHLLNLNKLLPSHKCKSLGT